MNIQGIVDKAKYIVDRHRLDEGVYARWLWQEKRAERDGIVSSAPGMPALRNLGVNEYGCADAANILYIIGQFIQEPEKRAAWIKTLRGLQNPETGMYAEPTHHTIHTTAHCIAALELFDAMPLYPLRGLEKYLQYEELDQLLTNLDWENSPWNNSHQGAGVFAALVITRTCSLEWQQYYFKWLHDRADPVTGLGLKGRHGSAPLYWQLNGWFHYFFNHEFAHMPIPYPEKLLDSCIAMYRNKETELDRFFGRRAGFCEIDWVFAMNRASRQTPHRNAEVKDLLMDFAQGFLAWLDAQDPDTRDDINDLHMLFGAMCAVAELQIALPGEFSTEYPLKNVLDRRPFI